MSVSPLDPESSASTNSATLTLNSQQKDSISSSGVLQVIISINFFMSKFCYADAWTKMNTIPILVKKNLVTAAIVVNM